MKRPMPAFKQGDVIKVPFPYTDRPTRQSRPALVVSTGELERLHGLLWVVMITSAGNRAWPEDVPVSDLKRAGLPFPSVIRPAKIATIEASDASKIGSVSPARLKQVRQWFAAELGC
jgi:mRNA interferase MazF